MKDELIREPFRFNPLKHHLEWIRDFTEWKAEYSGPSLIKEIRHIGTSVMDVYTGRLTIEEILMQITETLENEGFLSRSSFSAWAGKAYPDFRLATLSDGSQWILKYNSDENRYIHLFPARSSPHTFRVKANTLKSAILYIIFNGKDYVNEEDLNRARAKAGLSPVKKVAETDAVSEMIEILRNSY